MERQAKHHLNELSVFTASYEEEHLLGNNPENYQIPELVMTDVLEARKVFV